jgi:uncharacterized membrane protein
MSANTDCDAIGSIPAICLFTFNMKKDISVYRHIAKTISWRVLGTLDTIFLSYLITGDLSLATAIGGFEIFTKMILYFLHERVWYKIPFGVKGDTKK